MPGTSASGRRPKSVTELKLTGTYRADRQAYDTPDSPTGTPESLKTLSGDALLEWDRMIWRMELCGTLSKVDDAVLYQYCKLFADTEALDLERTEAKASLRVMEENIGDLDGSDRVAMFQEIGKLRHDIKGYSGTVRQNRALIRQFLVELGQTPAARSRVKLPAQKPKSKLDEYREKLA